MGHKWEISMNTFLVSYFCGYRKGNSAQHAVLTLLEKWRVLDRNEFGGAILMDLFKVFDTLNHEPL